MKKTTILLMLFCILLTGCTVVRIDTNNIDNIIKNVLKKDNQLFNRIGKGYKYYIPKGVTYIDTSELNDKLYSNGNYYYLYIDVVNYFNKNTVDYQENNELYYSKKIIGEKEGYIEIEEVNNNYYVAFVYNYARIEAIVKKDEIEQLILEASYILSTVKFNDNIIKLMLDEEYFTNKEEQYEMFIAKETENNTLGFSE
ncbi:MAG: hypothetical protein ACK5HP_01035 [Bacilli bacterium]